MTHIRKGQVYTSVRTDLSKTIRVLAHMPGDTRVMVVDQEDDGDRDPGVRMVPVSALHATPTMDDGRLYESGYVLVSDNPVPASPGPERLVPRPTPVEAIQWNGDPGTADVIAQMIATDPFTAPTQRAFLEEGDGSYRIIHDTRTALTVDLGQWLVRGRYDRLEVLSSEKLDTLYVPYEAGPRTEAELDEALGLPRNAPDFGALAESFSEEELTAAAEAHDQEFPDAELMASEREAQGCDPDTGVPGPDYPH